MNRTLIVILAIGGLIAVVDVWLAVTGGFQATISWYLWTNSRQFPIIAFLAGVLCGHLFWTQIYELPKSNSPK